MAAADKRDQFYSEPPPSWTSLHEGSLTHRVRSTPAAASPAPKVKAKTTKAPQVTGTKPPLEAPSAKPVSLVQVAESVGFQQKSESQPIFTVPVHGESTLPPNVFVPGGDVKIPASAYELTSEPVTAVQVIEPTAPPVPPLKPVEAEQVFEAEKTAEQPAEPADNKRRRRNRRRQDDAT